MFTRKSVSILILAALLLSLFPSVAGAQPPSTYAAITLTGVTSGTPAVGSDFTTDMEVSINTSGPGVVGVEAYIGYTAANVVPVDTDSSVPGVQPAELRSDFFGSTPTPAANEVLAAPSCPGGFATCIHLSMVGPAQTNKTGTIARLHWRGVAPGVGGFVILNPVIAPPPYPPAPYTTLSDADGYLIPLNSFPVTPIVILGPANVGIGGIVLRQGVPPAVGPGTHGCTQIIATSGTGFVAGPAFTLVAPPPDLPAQVNTAGGFLLAIVSGGTYTVRASYPGYLQAQKANVFVSGGQVLIGPTKLYGGDVNGDNNINILDIVTIIGSLGTTGVPVGSSAAVCVPPVEGANGLPPAVAPPPDSIVDINDDGVVNISDLAIAAGNFGKTGPTIWAP